MSTYNATEQRLYTRRRRAALAAGTWAKPVLVDETVQRVAELRAQGMSVDAIAAAAGLARSTVAPLAWHGTHSATRTRISPFIASAIASVTMAKVPGWALIPNVGTRRRIEALQVMGWDLRRIGEHLGITFQGVKRLKDQQRVSRDRADAIAKVYDRLCMVPGPSRRTRQIALANGWAPPLAWDDDTIDDPNARPFRGARAAREEVDEVAVARALSGEPVQLTYLERVAAVRALAALGHSDAEVAERLGVADRTVQRIRAQHQIASQWAGAV